MGRECAHTHAQVNQQRQQGASSAAVQTSSAAAAEGAAAPGGWGCVQPCSVSRAYGESTCVDATTAAVGQPMVGRAAPHLSGAFGSRRDGPRAVRSNQQKTGSPWQAGVSYGFHVLSTAGRETSAGRLATADCPWGRQGAAELQGAGAPARLKAIELLGWRAWPGSVVLHGEAGHLAGRQVHWKL